METARAVIHFCMEVLHWPLSGILLLGRSIGTGPVMALASWYEVAGIILVAPFLSVQEICREIVGPAAQLLTERFNNKARIVGITSPCLLVHGKRRGRDVGKKT